MITFIRNTVFGALIGITFVVPGMSGSTMAVMLGIYDDIIGSISRFMKDKKRSLLLLIPLAVGAAAGTYAFSGVAKWALEDWPLATNLFLIGLMVGSLPLIYAYATKRAEGSQESLATSSLVVCALAFAFMMALLFLSPDEVNQIAETTFSTSLALRLLIVSAIACLTMVIPGVSGILMFVIFGVYGTVITAVNNLDVAILAPVAVGAIAGLLIGARLIDVLLSRWEKQTYWGILGLVGGSIVALGYTAAHHLGRSSEIVIGVITLVAGIGIATLFGIFALKKEGKKERT